MRTTMIRIAAGIAAWIPIFAFWVVLAMVYARMTLAYAMFWAALTQSTAALLGIAVWKFCARMTWPRSMRVAFYAKHFLAATLYAFLWLAAVTAIELALGLRQSIGSSPLFGWWLLTGLWVYGVIAGVSYSMQSQVRAARAEAALAAARLEALRSRLHPHFLFNALHTVGALVRADPAQAESAVEKLGDMLRYTLDEPGGETVPFAEEWEFTRKYLEFEQLRYGERLRVKAAIDDESKRCNAPSFALQTLVENAVRHSIATRPEGGAIDIAARASDTRLHVRVRDDGSNGSSDGTRFGLHALRERLHAVYGETAQLTVESAPNGFEVSFTIPREAADDD
jgi:hypothetical protein